ncbi:MAG: hypothetical protein U0X92_12970 [Anaerolineales bacterium]
MDTKQYIQIFDALDDNDQSNSATKNGRKQKYPLRNPKKESESDHAFKSQQDDSASTYKFTYKEAARFEEWWLLDSIGPFYEHKLISDVLRRLKGGKEASVYLYDIQG